MKNFLGIIMFIVGSVLGKIMYKELGMIGGGMILLVFYGIYLLVKADEVVETKKAESDKEQIKIDIVNNDKYIDLKKNDRVKYLRNLRKQILSELAKLNKELKLEEDKLNDIPVDIAKYIKPKDTSLLKNDILQLENKKLAIDELICLETDNKKQIKTKKDTDAEEEYGWQTWD